MHIVVGSGSERKIGIARQVFARHLEVEVTAVGCEVASGVPETPHDRETLEGARNRALACRRLHDADYCIGLESGLVERYGQVYEEAWAIAIARDGTEHAGYSSGLRVPDYVLRRMEASGRKHYEVMTALEEELDLPHDTWLNYSGGVLPRWVSLEEALRNAVIQALAPEASLYRR
jgi:non-canonical (house-cleaning) NTP pyrophosphatase